MTTSKSFLIYKHLEPVINQLSDKDAGILFKAIFLYERTQEEPKLTAEANIVFTMFKMYLDNARCKYEQRCETNRNNAKRAKAKGSESLPIGSKRNPIVPNNNNNNNINNNTNKKVLSKKKGTYTKAQWRGIDE